MKLELCQGKLRMPAITPPCSSRCRHAADRGARGGMAISRHMALASLARAAVRYLCLRSSGDVDRVSGSEGIEASIFVANARPWILVCLQTVCWMYDASAPPPSREGAYGDETALSEPGSVKRERSSVVRRSSPLYLVSRLPTSELSRSVCRC